MPPDLRVVPVADASVVVDWVAPGADPVSPALAVLDRLVSSGAELLAPRLLLHEVSNALLTGVRRKRWTGHAADTAYALLRELPVRLVDEPADLDRAWELARRYDDHPVYDMVYVALAERSQTTLITAGEPLRRCLVGLRWVVSPDEFR